MTEHEQQPWTDELREALAAYAHNDAWFAPHGLRSYLDGGGLPFRVNIPIGTDWRTTLQARPTDTEANDA